MKTRRLILSLFVTILNLLMVQAQEVVVNVKPVRNILPPQVMLYLSNTGQYFSVTLMNNSGEDQLVYFGLSLRQIMPSSDLEIVVPGGPHIPKQPIVIPAGQTKILDAVEMRTLFNHVSSDNIQMPANLFDDVLSGSFGNLPEGTYELVLHAYKWDPMLATPQLVSNPTLSRCSFNVCYEAQAPQWTAPNVQDGEMGVYSLSKQYPMFQWMAPVINCNPSARTFTYDIKIVQLTGMQTPDVAIDKAPVVYQVSGLTMPQCLIPTHVVNTLSTSNTYVARVTARSNSTQIGSLDYIHVLNEGMSDLRLFRIKDYSIGMEGPTTQYGVPKLISPEPYGLNSTKYATFSPSEPMVKWTAPQATGNTSQKVNFRYKVRIVSLMREYELSGQGLSDALSKEKPLYESPLIDATQYMLPISVINEFENKSMYAMEVVAIPDTVAGAYKKYSFADGGRSLPSLFTSAAALVSPPVLVSPRSYDEYMKVAQGASRKNSEIIYSSSPVVKWSTPDVAGKLPESLGFVYDVRIVMPTEDYEVNSTDMKRALEELEPVYARTDIKGTSLELPASLFHELDLSAGYIMSVTARLQGNEADMTMVTMIRDGESEPAFITFMDSEKPTTYSVPRFTTPKPVSEMTTHIGSRVSWKKPLISWTAPEMSGAKGDEVSFSYKIKIVEPTGDYEPNLEGTMKAVEKLKPLYEKSGITDTEFLLPSEFMEKADSSMLYVMRVYAIPDTSSTGKGYTYESQGQSVPAIVYFREGDDNEGTGSMAYRDTVNNFINPEIVTPSFTANEGARKRYVNTDLAVKWEKPEYYGGHGEVRADSVRFTYDLELFRAKDYMERKEMLAQEPVIARRGLEVMIDTIRWSELEGKVEKNDYLLLRVMPRAVNDTAAVFLNDSINVVDFAMTEPFSKRYFQCANQVELDNMRPTTMKAADLQGKTVTVGEYDLVLDGTLSDLSSPGAIKGTGHVIWAPLLDITWELCVKFDSIVINTDNQVIAGMVLTDKAPDSKMTSSGVVDTLFTDWGIDNLIGDTGIPYADHLQNELTGQVNGLAEKINLASYYEQVTKGYARMENLLDGGTIKDVGFPLEIPERYNPSPVNIQINTMKFAPTYASMDLIGTFVVPETEATKGQILVFGAPRMCISPKSLIPEGGTIALLKDFTVNDPKSDFSLTFKAPADVVEPVNGCYLVWSENKFAELTAEIDMAMPNLKKVDDLGNVTEQQPILNVLATIRSWDDWIGSATLDAFEHESLPGFTFNECKVVIDHSSNQNHATCTRNTFPGKYNWEEAQVDPEAIEEWQGVYISSVEASLPKSFSVGNGGRMNMFFENMIFDKSGCSLTAGISNLINYKAGDNGSIGGFAFSLDSIYVDVIQDDFNRFKMKGCLQIPLLKDSVHYECNIQPLSNYENGKEGYCYVFRTYQMDKLSFDFILGDLDFDEKLTYFLVEAYDKEDGTTKTNCELCIGGEVTIVGAKAINEQLEHLPFDIHIPGIKFCKMRIANNKSFEARFSEEAKRMQSARRELENDWLADARNKWWNKAEDKEFADGDIYINFGQWGYASPEKTIGPFTLTLTECDIDLNVSGKDAELEFLLGGKITFNKDLKISGETKLGLKSKIRNITSLSDMSIEFSKVEFHEATIEVNTGQVDIKGTLKVEDSKGRSGYSGELTMKIVDIFECSAKGGYYEENPGEEDNFDWGYFELTCEDISFTPITIYGLHGGFYFNCYSESTGEKTSKATPKKGAIGIILGMGMKAGEGTVFDGSFDCTVVVYRNPETDECKLTTFKFKGDIDCAAMIKAGVNIVYENTDKDKYFQLDLSIDVKADGGASEAVSKIENGLAKLQELNDKFEGYIQEAKCGLDSIMSDSNESNDRSKFNERMTNADMVQTDDPEAKTSNKKTSAMTWKINLELKVTMKRDGQPLKKTDWYVWLGKPEPRDARCAFILVDFEKKPVISVSVGADAYLCFGSELPNGGQLPPLPEKLVKFLDGGQHGAAVSDNLSEATAAQEKSKKGFNAMSSELGGGIMLGASVWGYIDVNLGLFYASAGATAGFDIVLAKMPDNAECVNLGRKPGFKSGSNYWYARGQLYAYLYAKMGLHIDLGFFDKKIDLVDCGIGGVLQCAMPNPNYFMGKARVKIRLLGGLVNLNKKFSFECGDVCQIFLGNALDNFVLFDRCSIGTDDFGEFNTYCYKASKDPELVNPYEVEYNKGITPYFVTNADINSDISIVDPTDLDKIANNTNIVEEDAQKARASRKFRFEVYTGKAKLYEYASLSHIASKYSSPNATYEVEVTYQNDKVLLHKLNLNPNRYYKLEIKGRALEFRNGTYMDPEKYNSETHKYEPEEWYQTKTIYFCTKPEMEASAFTDTTQPQMFAKLAYPTYITREGPQLVNDITVNAPLVDMRCPLISLDGQYKGRLFNNPTGKLTWKLYNDTVSAKPIQTRNNLWIENDSVSILTPENPFTYSDTSNPYAITLEYEWTENFSEQSMNTVMSYNTYASCETTARNQAIEKIYETYFPGQAPGYGFAESGGSASLTKDPITGQWVNTATESTTSSSSSSSTSSLSGQKTMLSTTPSSTISQSKLGATASLASSSSSSGSTVTSSSLVSSKLDGVVLGKGSGGPSLLTGAEAVKAYVTPNPFEVVVEDLGNTDAQGLHQYHVTVKKPGTNSWSEPRKMVVYKQRVKAFDKTYTKDEYHEGGAPKYYGTLFTGTILTDIEKLVTLDKPYTDRELLGGATKTSEPLKNRLGQYYIVQEPAMYIDYLANMFFIGGYRAKSADDYLNYDITTTEALIFNTPYGTTQGKLRILSEWGGDKQLYDNYQTIEDLCYLKLDRFQKMGYNHPIFCDPLDSLASYMYGEEIPAGVSAGVQPWHPLTQKCYLDIIRGLNKSCQTMCSNITAFCYDGRNAYKKDVRDLTNEYMQGYIKTDFSAATVNGMMRLFEIKYPSYQLGLVWSGSMQGASRNTHIYDIIKMDYNKNYRHPRIRPYSFDPVKGIYTGDNSEWSEVLYEWNYRTPHKSGFSSAQVWYDAEKAMKNVQKLQFRRYRVNSWDFKNKCWRSYYYGMSPTISESYSAFSDSPFISQPFK